MSSLLLVVEPSWESASDTSSHFVAFVGCRTNYNHGVNECPNCKQPNAISSKRKRFLGTMSSANCRYCGQGVVIPWRTLFHPIFMLMLVGSVVTMMPFMMGIIFLFLGAKGFFTIALILTGGSMGTTFLIIAIRVGSRIQADAPLVPENNSPWKWAFVLIPGVITALLLFIPF